MTVAHAPVVPRAASAKPQGRRKGCDVRVNVLVEGGAFEPTRVVFVFKGTGLLCVEAPQTHSEALVSHVKSKSLAVSGKTARRPYLDPGKTMLPDFYFQQYYSVPLASPQQTRHVSEVGSPQGRPWPACLRYDDFRASSNSRSAVIPPSLPPRSRRRHFHYTLLFPDGKTRVPLNTTMRGNIVRPALCRLPRGFLPPRSYRRVASQDHHYHYHHHRQSARLRERLVPGREATERSSTHLGVVHPGGVHSIPPRSTAPSVAPQ
ncbi:hypothetical protein E2C01_024267 [Portunus trituberculatus]|uniref:Uncharacterized protein n=1 Tax=Portunus trituberculatus TaxID=210409 RepID=A0A5B7EC94_PORTR|nr:hypothetical protein [Portunus trituberculatus]